MPSVLRIVPASPTALQVVVLGQLTPQRLGGRRDLTGPVRPAVDRDENCAMVPHSEACRSAGATDRVERVALWKRILPDPRTGADIYCSLSRRDGQCGADRGNQKGQHKTKPLILFMV